MATFKLHVKKDDMVKVMAGKEKGKTGKVLRVFPTKGRVVVESLNVVKRHTRPTQLRPEGGIVEKEAAMSISNVMLINTLCNLDAIWRRVVNVTSLQHIEGVATRHLRQPIMPAQIGSA